MKSGKLALISMIIVVGYMAVMTGGCNNSKQIPNTTPAVIPYSAPPAAPPAAPPQQTIPDGYKTYNSETGIFSIAYPPDWEMALHLIPDLEKNTTALKNSTNAGNTVEEIGIVFFAGRRTDTEYSPKVFIMATPTPDKMTRDQAIESVLQGLRESLPDFQMFSRIETTAGGRKATILDYEGTYPGQKKNHFLQMLVLTNNTLWTVSCNLPYEDFAKWKIELDSVVRSLRINK